MIMIMMMMMMMMINNIHTQTQAWPALFRHIKLRMCNVESLAAGVLEEHVANIDHSFPFPKPRLGRLSSGGSNFGCATSSLWPLLFLRNTSPSRRRTSRSCTWSAASFRRQMRFRSSRHSKCVPGFCPFKWTEWLLTGSMHSNQTPIWPR